MNLFGVGALEIVLVAIIAVVVLGPERFPQAAVQVARAIKYLRGYANSATSDLRAEFNELTKEYEGLRDELNEMRGTFTREAGSVTQAVSRVMTETKPELKAPTMKELLGNAAPIIEPGGELPPERNGSNGAKT